MMYNPTYQQPGVWNGQSVQVNTKSYCQTLTQEEMDSLKQSQEEFTLGITKEDQLRAICMHRDIEGHSTLEMDGVTGLTKCKICGESFNIVDRCSDNDIKAAVENLSDILQTTKTMYYDMPVDSAKKFYTILALLKKIPGLYKLATDNFAKHENAINGWNYNGGGSIINDYNMLYNGFMPNMQMGYQQPMMGAPMMMGQPMPMQNQGNPFGVNGQPVMQPTYAPTMQGYQYSPAPAPTTAPVQPVAADVAAPVAPAAETVQVETQFNA